MPLIFKRETRTAQFFSEVLNNTVSLDMVLIPGGSFLMGSPEDELDRFDNESPQHLVTVPSFCMGKYPVTQAQYQTVMSTNPANFKGGDRPVEQVSWEDAMEFCDRLSQHTKREYRLPSEAEWEYACRAGTTTPFHLGETIATDLANYNGNYTYGRGAKGIYRKETTPVGTFPPNAFGLYDMHGNVWEWCLEHWHDNYEEAPTDGSAWLSEDKGSKRLLGGGSWNSYPQYCRSSVRNVSTPGFRNFNIGFRVLCLAART